MKNWALGTIVFFEGRFMGRGLLRSPQMSLLSLCAFLQYCSHRRSQVTVQLESDVDLLVAPTVETTLFDIGAMRLDLFELLGVPVDVLTPKVLPEKFRATVLAKAQSV